MLSHDLWFGREADDLRVHPDLPDEPRRPEAPVELAGWCGGDGPAIPSHQWPRSRDTGLPLLHMLTLRLPADYRRRGPDLPGVALFGSSEAFQSVPGVEEAYTAGRVDDPGDDLFLVGLQQHLADPHPHVDYRTDILGATFALVWLTEAELAGGGKPPEPAIPAAVAEEAGDGSLAMEFGLSAWFTEDIESRCDVWLAERTDPNTGRTPNEADEDGYVDDVQEELEEKWGMSHLGGTVLHVQGMPEGLTPWFLELESGVGGANFGDGNAQIDLDSDAFDWACG